MKKYLFVLISSLFFTYTNSIIGQVILENDNDFQNIGNRVSFFVDESDSLSANQILKKQFVVSTALAPNFNVTKAAVWLRFQVVNKSDFETFLFQIALPSLTDFRFYEINNDEARLLKSEDVKMGLNLREIQEPGAFQNIDLKTGEQKEYLFRVKSNQNLVLPIRIGTRKAIIETTSIKKTISGVFAGVFLIMFLYNLFVYFTVKDKAYLYYVIYLLVMGLTQLSIQGLLFKFLWPNNLVLGNAMTLLFANLGGIFAILFIQNFLDSKHNIPKIHRLFNISIGIFAMSIVLSFVHLEHLSFQIMQMNTMVGSVIGLVAGFKVWKQGYRSAIYFIIAWSVLLVGAVAFILKDYGILPYNSFTENLFLVASSLEIVLLSFALGDKINVYKQEAFSAVQDKKKILQEQNVELEKQVKSRTIELDEKNEILESTLIDLKEAQVQLVQSEKMSSLGLLTAGIAHEINNPMNYARQSIVTIKRDVQDLKDLIGKYDTSFEKNKEVISDFKMISDFKNEIELDYLNEEIDNAIDDVEDGIKRAVEIASELKTFSRLDQANLKVADLHVGLNSTIELMKSEFQKHKIEVVKDFQEIPRIECLASKLNQVFMNIVNNGIYAILHADKNENRKIMISTKNNVETKEIIISFKDCGMGMNDETKRKIFDPFFTTKEVGDGSGLGMSISYGIIEEHGGRFEVESEIGVGTKISIVLPTNKSITES